MSIYNVLKEIEMRQGEEVLGYKVLRLDQLLSRYATIIELSGNILPSKLSIFSQLELGSEILLNKGDLYLNILRAGDLNFRIENA